MPAPRYRPEQVDAQAEMLANRVRKRFRHLAPRFAAQGTTAFRVYDQDIPEIRAVVDWYEGHAVLSVYERDQTDLPAYVPTLARAVATGLDIPPAHVHARGRRTGVDRYGRLDRGGVAHEAREGGLRYGLLLDDFVDVGLFVDHRPLRARVRAEAAGLRVLNLFAYTGSFTVAAAAGGAAATTSVDVSPAYLARAEDNLRRNGLLGPAHTLVAAEVGEWLDRARGTWDLAIVDPPSRSDRGGFDVLLHHPALVARTLPLLRPGGVLWFSTNHHRFVPRFQDLDVAEVRELTAETTPEDVRPGAHRSWRIVARG